MPYRPIYLWEITVNKLFTAVGTPAHSRPTVAGPTGRQGPSGRSPAVGTYEGWVTSYGVCGHLLDSLSAWGHSVTLFKPEQAHFGRFYAIMFFRKASPQTEGRRDAHPLIKTSPVCQLRALLLNLLLLLKRNAPGLSPHSGRRGVDF